MADYTNAAQQRLIRVLTVLFSDIVDGVTNSTIAREVGCSPAAVTRDLENLRTAGLAERDESTGRWLLTPRLPRQALTAMSVLDRRQRRLDEVRQRMSATSL
ncbi:IclR family transcriptional regulator [Burkholderia cepacia]|uniref:IclR family transcriptional regulator n=1 Tax=Burkholderia TaxID=32008 RepID=UPI000755C8B0|nr:MULTISPECIES: IclR family transcriptional regulator [Burkholderia]KWH38510.1 IclR family transcriptional regulator [Burkholderia cepacia]MCA8356065.1 IclR family transcriptional regulator [Burkholderia cepacia]HDR9757548.1 IclR family transcriptional regulator [Burkholderia cepacia ATCC 25416]